MQNDNNSTLDALPFEMKWDNDFYDQMYYPEPAPGKPDLFAQAKAAFDVKTTRENTLKIPPYPLEKDARIWVGIYGLMLKRILGCTDARFVQQGDIVGVVFEFYEQGGVLKLNAFGSNNTRSAIEGNEQYPIGKLYDILKGDLDAKLSFPYTKSHLLGLMGFNDPNNYPTCSKENLILYPVITSVLYKGAYQTLFSLACELPPMPGNKGNSAYAPPCPPFCYP